MRKTKEQKNKLSSSVVLSIILHVLLFGFIILGSLDKIIRLGGGGEVVDAIMVDPGAVIEHYNQLQRQQNSAKQAVAEREKRQQQREELRKQQEEEQKRLKMVEEERIKIAREAEQQRKQAEKAAQKAKDQQKIAEEEVAKAKAEQERLIKEQAETKARAEAQVKKEAEVAKVKAEAAKQAATVDSLLGGLTAQHPTQQTGDAAAAGQGGNRKSGASSSDVANYAGKIKAAITSKFYDADIYRGKTCELSIKLASDGMLISITPKSSAVNDQSLCDAAIRAAKTATMPKPPSRSIYDAFNEEGSALIFKP